ncbi:MAG: membrane protein [Rhizobacter sp.]
MFGQSKPVVLESYGSRRKRGRPPRWLVLLLSGVAIGAIGVVVVQERYLPPRLSPAESAKLRESYETADAERLRLQQSLGETSQKLNTALAEKTRLSEDLNTSRATTERLREDLSAVVATLPPDPRGGGVEVRAGRFTTRGGMLVYDVVLTRERAGSKPMAGVLQLTVAGVPASGFETTVALKPVTLSLGSHEIVRGSQPLPEGFKPRETTIRVLDRPAGNSLGMRVMLVK